VTDEGGGGAWLSPDQRPVPHRTPAGPYPPPPAYPPPPGYGGYPYPPTPATQTEGTAVGALICAIGAYVTCIPVLAIVALPLATAAKKKIAFSGGKKTGLGLVTAARWLAGINLGLWTVVVAVAVASIVIDVSTGR
jgi:hypothetical protein